MLAPRWFVLALAVAETASAAAADLRLDEALARARAANPGLRAAADDLSAARGRLAQARLLAANPVVSGDLARHSEGPDVRMDSGVAVAQEIEVGGQRGLRIGSATHDIARAAQLLADRGRIVEAEVRRSFFGLAASERRRALAVQARDVAVRLVDTVRRRARAGEAGALDTRLAEIESARAAQALATADGERAAAAARLAAAIGAGPEEAIAVAAEGGAPAAVPPEEALVARALAERPDLAAAREERARLDSEAGLEHRRGVVPNPVLRGFYRKERINEHIAGGEVSVPLPIWNRQQGTEAALRAQAAAAGAEADRLTAAIPREVRVALVRRTAAAETWRRWQQETRPAVTAARDLLERGFTAGYVSLPERLVQQDRLLQAEAAGIDAWRDLQLAETDLIEAVGGALP